MHLTEASLRRPFLGLRVELPVLTSKFFIRIFELRQDLIDVQPINLNLPIITSTPLQTNPNRGPLGIWISFHLCHHLDLIGVYRPIPATWPCRDGL